DLHPELLAMLADSRIRHIAGEFEPGMLEGQTLVIAATDDADTNKAVSAAARERNVPVNVVDTPQLCSFIMPSIVERDPVQIAISTGGASPVLARLLRARLETMIPSGYGKLAALVRDFRDEVKRRLPMPQRRAFWERVLQGPIAERMFSGQDRQAIDDLQRALHDAEHEPEPQGEVYLVGAGPGDPDLLTFRALRLMQQADIVFYDRLVAPELVDLVRRDADRIYVGKERDQHTVPQEEINRLLVEHARAGKRVLRLKGGDPFIFGRGGEEIETLSDAGIPFQIVPGITAAAGCASYAGIPLTHRDHAHTCIFVTGHMKDGKLALNWDTLVRPGQTIAVYMGVKAVAELCSRLVEHGMDSNTPVAVVQKATMKDQKTCIGTLSTMPSIVKQQDIQPPSMIIVGTVVSLHEKLAWYEPVDRPPEKN
ncbi:MAG: siroheme synthase CysG, partial [Gammaproteobacteria bacterium]|nr:siroheme synthase CysG [Gammaproteobacteria bacterium]